MLKTYLKIALRHLWQTRLYACINIFGLAVGLACVLLAVFYVADEHSFDQFHKRNQSLYRVTTTKFENGKRLTTGGTGQVQGPAFKMQVPEVEEFVRIMGGDIYADIRSEGKALRLQTLFVDESFFNAFSFSIISGNKKQALDNVNSIVITEKTALKFFNRLDVIGQRLEMDADPSAIRLGKPLVVSAVVQDPPFNSSIQFDALLPMRFMQLSFEDTSWDNAYLGTFIALRPDADLQSVTAKFNRIGLKNLHQQVLKIDGNDTPSISYGLQKITDIHLNPMQVSDKNREGGVINGSSSVYSYLFLGIACFILLMASINFINITIANSLKRGREIGVRKVTGSTQFQILTQFLGESAFLCLIALVLAGVITWQVLPLFNQLSGKEILFGQFLTPKFFGLLLMTFLINVFTAGFYPAFLLSRLSPVKVLYGQASFSGNHLFSKSLLVFQFSVSVILGVSTLVFYQQMRLIKTKDLGYNPEQVVRIGVPGITDLKDIADHFRYELKGGPGISELSFVGEFGFRDARVKGRSFQSYYRSVDRDYLSVMSMKLKAGRNFSAHFPSDKKYGVLVNEQFVKAAGLVDPVGQVIHVDSYFTKEPVKIIGVVRDFHFGSFRERIQPMVMLASGQYAGHSIFAKIAIEHQKRAITELQASFKRLFPTAVFEYSFLSDANATDYAQEMRWQKIIAFVTILSVFICIAGLFGLAHLATTQRKKETGIRIVLGATISNIVFLFSRDFLKMLVLAVIIACPASYFAMELWLSDFAYRIMISWWMFGLVAGIAVLITLVTVGSQAVRAALTNPVNSLQTGSN